MDFAGVFAPLPTPLDEHDQVDIARLRAAFPRWVASPLSGFVVLGSNGEAGLLDDAESDRVVDEARSLVPEGRLLIAGTGRESTQAAVRAARRAGSLGADAVLVRTPAVFKSQMTGEVLFRHYTEVADKSPVPVLLYNFPALTGVNLLPSTVARLSEHPNIVGMKESAGDIAQLSDLVTQTPPEFAVLAGSGSTFHAALGAGVTGGVLALSGLLPESCVRLFAYAKEGRHDEARDVQRRLLPLARLVTEYGVPGLKAAMLLVGCDVGLPRPPLAPATATAIAVLREALAAEHVAGVVEM